MPVNGWARAGVGVADGDGADAAGGGVAETASGVLEQAARAEAASTPADADVTRKQRTSWTSSDKRDLLSPRG
jgi:hypothetical protein